MPNGGYFEESPTYAKLYDKLLGFGQLSQINNTLLFAGKVKDITAGKNTLLEKSTGKIQRRMQQHMKWNGYEEM